MSNIAIPQASRLREGYVRLRSRLANARKTGERIAVELGRTGVGLVGTGGIQLVNGYFNDPAIGGARVDAIAGTIVKTTSLFLGDIAGPLVGALGDSMIWTAVGSVAYRKGLEASAEANEVEPIVILQRREDGMNDDGSAIEAEAAA